MITSIEYREALEKILKQNVPESLDYEIKDHVVGKDDAFVISIWRNCLDNISGCAVEINIKRSQLFYEYIQLYIIEKWIIDSVKVILTFKDSIHIDRNIWYDEEK